MELFEYFIELLREADPCQYPEIMDRLEKWIRRKEFQLIKGGRYEAQPDTLKGKSTL
jgi:hypothetical protein